MSVSVPLECKYFDPQDCEEFKPFCTKTKSGKCQRKRGGLDLPLEEVLSYFRVKREKGNNIEQTHIKRGGIKVSGEMTAINQFNSILTVSQNVSHIVTNESIVLRFFIGEEEILVLTGYIKKMTEENLAMDEKIREFSGNSRYNSVNSDQVECNVLQINWIKTKEAYRGNRFSIYAMHLVEQYAKQVYDIKYITLEDHTSVDAPNNLYYKLNFNILTWGKNSDGPYQMWKDWHKLAGMNNIVEDERMISIEEFESSDEIRAIQQNFRVEK